MKRNGFTLQEILISLVIIGVIAAMTIPAIIGTRPDETKIKYMKAYNALTSITNELLGDSTIYWTEFDNSNPPKQFVGLEANARTQDDCNALIYAHKEFENTLKKVTTNHKNPDDEEKTYNNIKCNGKWSEVRDIKYPVFLASRLNLQSNIACSSNKDAGHDCTFTTTDGTVWKISTQVGASDYPTTVTVDVNAGNGTQTTAASATDLNDVDTFEFEVTKTGGISASDDLGKVFLKTPTDMHRKKEDRKEAGKTKKDTKTESSTSSSKPKD